MAGKRKLSENKILFIVSLLAGILLVTFLAKGKLPENTLMDQVLTRAYLEDGWNKKELLWQCLLQKGTVFLVIMILAFTQMRISMFRVVTVWIGFLFGVLLKLFYLWYGIQGVGLFFASILPHYFFYWMAYGLLYWESDQKKNSIKRNFIPIVLVIGVVIMGILFESYVNPFLVNLCIKIFFL